MAYTIFKFAESFCVYFWFVITDLEVFEMILDFAKLC